MRARGGATPLLLLALCLLLFYGPILLSAGSVVTSSEDDPVGHMLISLGDRRPAGRFFHYFDLSANTRLWGQDVKYNPLHFIRLISIALGSNQIGWGILIAFVHSLLFLTVYGYSRRVFGVSKAAALTGAAVAFFSASWLEWIALVYWISGALLLAVSICEYGLFVTTGRRRHLLICVLANAFQPYVTQVQALLPSQLYFLSAVLLMALCRKGSWRSTVSPLALRVWPLTALGWVPILAPVLFAVGSGLTTREAFKQLTWGVHGSVLTSLGGLLVPAPLVVGDLLVKLGWIGVVMPPNSFLFGSFLFLPSFLALWQSGRRPLRMMVVGVALYCASVIAPELFSIPSVLIRSLGFLRIFAFPVLSGFVVAAAIDLRELCSLENKGARILHRLYQILLVSTVVGSIALWAVSAETLIGLASRFGLVGSGTMLPGFLRDTRVLTAGIALGLASYLCYGAVRRSQSLTRWRGSVLGFVALSITIVAPALCYGYGLGWYERPQELDAVASPPSELQFLRKRIPNYEYRVGVILASEMHLAQGDWDRFWSAGSQREDGVLSALRENDLRLRQGLAFVLPALHFFAPIHNQLRKEGNPFLQRLQSPEAPFLNRRNIIVRPGGEIFEEYGVRYWLSNYDLQRFHPQKFARLYQGEYASVFENQDAKPVAYFLNEPEVPLPFQYVASGVAIGLPAGRGGELSVHLDLRKMDARAVDAKGRVSPLLLESAGQRWAMNVPPGNSVVVFTAREYGLVKLLAIGAGAAFLLLLPTLMGWPKRSAGLNKNCTGPRGLL